MRSRQLRIFGTGAIACPKFTFGRLLMHPKFVCLLSLKLSQNRHKLVPCVVPKSCGSMRIYNEFACFEVCVKLLASYVACRTKNRAIALIFSRQQHDACQKGTPPLDSPITNLGITLCSSFCINII